MASKVHEDFQPHFEVLEEKDNVPASIKVHFPGFVRKEELKVQLIGKPTPHELWISRERKSGSDKKRWRFKEEFPVPADCDTDAITAKLENGILRVTLPRKTPSAKRQEETKTLQASTKVAPPEPKPLQPQSPTGGDVKERREKASFEAVRGDGKAVSGEVQKPEEPKSLTPQTIKREGYDGTCLEMNLMRRGKALNLALVVLAAIGIRLYVKNIYDY
ncbi:unnamed protein product [Cuscuta campestris]|uniref:SHSP domain-containing protein n=1 Tax=Cuscuta campestris TaxID=132261 RepID=A0A484L4Y5_9ASTE|nr:unnamed protein product [Cuscuta campestris]